LSLLTDSSIDALPKQVGMPTVARVLLDPVHPELPNRESLFSQTLTKVHVLGQRVVGPRLLANQVRTGSVNNGLTASLAKHLAQCGVTVNCVSPGVILTPSLQRMFTDRRGGSDVDWANIEPEVTADYARTRLVGSGDPKISPTPLPFSPAHAPATSTAPTSLSTEASPEPSDLASITRSG